MFMAVVSPWSHRRGAIAVVPFGARNRNRTGTLLSLRGILSPLCLPISPSGRSGRIVEARPGIEPRYTALQAAVFCSKSITYYAHPPAIRPPQISNIPVCRKSCITVGMIADTGVATLPLLTCCKIWHRREHRFSSHHCRCLTCCSTAAMNTSHACSSRTEHRYPRPMQTATRSCRRVDARDQRRF